MTTWEQFVSYKMAETGSNSYDAHTELDIKTEAILGVEGNDSRILDRIQERWR